MGSPAHHAVTEGAEVWAALFVCHCIACAYLHPTWNIISFFLSPRRQLCAKKKKTLSKKRTPAVTVFVV
jgi:hypothetical protein